MAVAKTLGYDHPAYQVPVVIGGPTTVGANGVGTKFVAYTAMQLRAVQMRPIIASTAAGSQPLCYTISGTTTSTATLTVLTSAAIANITNVLSTAVDLAAGDVFYATHGTDATAVVGVNFQCYTTPGASLACVA
jgi:hypothetical protein